MLSRPRPTGPAVGFYRGEAISAVVVDDSGRRYTLCGHHFTQPPRLLRSWPSGTRRESRRPWPHLQTQQLGIDQFLSYLASSATGSELISQGLCRFSRASGCSAVRQSRKKINPPSTLTAGMSNSEWRFLIGFWACVALATWLMFLLGL
jgi:hypothetical protein